MSRSKKKPIGRKNYGSIGHLPNSRLGPGDHSLPDGQAAIATVKTRDRHDMVIVQEKLDGSNVGVARIGDDIYPLVRAGYLATTSPFEQHHMFARWAEKHHSRFLSVLQDGERLVGEWLAQAHGTRYELHHEPFVAFDIMRDAERKIYDVFKSRIGNIFTLPFEIHVGGACDVEWALNDLGEFGRHGAVEPVEGLMYRVERKGKVDFLAKYVRHDKQDGKYLSAVSGMPDVWNWREVNTPSIEEVGEYLVEKNQALYQRLSEV